MSKWMLAAGAAALAMMTPAFAEKGQGGKNSGKQSHASHNMKADRGGNDRGARAQKQRGADRVTQKSRVDGNRAQRVRIAQNDDRGRGGDKMRSRGRDDDRGRTQVKVDNRGRDDDRRQGKVHNRGSDHVRTVRMEDGRNRGRNWDDDVKVVRVDRDDDDFRWGPRWDGRGVRLGFVDGCPPGLAKKGNGCLPPGQAKKLVGTALAPTIMSRSLAGPYRLWYPDNDDYLYRWDDDYIYRVRRDGGLIDALFPYANRDYYYYPVGAPYPDYYNYYNVPYQYQSFYPDGGDYWYRYGDGAIYMVDPETRMIQGIAALLTGAPLTVGQPLPPSYGVYNVPLSYRSTYYDTPDAWYRYNDGYIYRVDPTTQLITAVINALV